ncbi:MAG: nucleoside-diphosphate sugar epimerase/dehydratase [Sphingorhabdus sp.]
MTTTVTNLEALVPQAGGPVHVQLEPENQELGTAVLAGPFARTAERLRNFGWRRTVRFASVISLDFAAVIFTLAAIMYQFGDPLHGMLGSRAVFLLLFGIITTSTALLVGLYGRSWRFLSFADCCFLAFTIILGLAISWAVALTLPQVRAVGISLLPMAMVHWSLLTVAMGSMRLLRRGLREWEQQRVLHVEGQAAGSQPAKRALLLGTPEWSRSVIDLVRADRSVNIDFVGVLLPHRDVTIDRLSGVPVLGSPDMLAGVVEMLAARNLRPDSIIMCDDGRSLSHHDMAKLVHRARDLGLGLSRVKDPWSQLLQGQPKINMEDLPLTELLGRKEFSMERDFVSRQIGGECILVTGAGGTIGSELVRQLASFGPSKIVLVDHSEYNLYAIEMELRDAFPDLEIHPELCSIRQASSVRRVFARHRPAIVYHAAALKHVPIVEANPCAGVHTNVIGTRIIADAVCEFGAKAMVQVSTDKAVNPVGMMGATKRVGELYCQALDLCGVDDTEAPRFMTVRFGNVLGSSGSIVPLFKKQISQGKPLTITHPDIVRFFMTVKEAVQLILQSSSRALEEGSERGNIFVLDMGDPVRIVDLAQQMIRLSGLEPDVDVEIKFIGLRPGEKLFEELFDTCERQTDSAIPGIFEASSNSIPLPLITRAIRELEKLVASGDHDEVCRITHNLVKMPSSVVGGGIFFSQIPHVTNTAKAAELSHIAPA